MASSIAIDAYAKINLGLKVLGLREDGYHEIETKLQSISLADRIHLSKTTNSEITLSVNVGLGIPSEQNLIHKATQLFLSDRKISSGLSIELTKMIPSAAGLGGGSSDAAATLVALNKLYQTALSLEQLQLLGAELGSDVPFFIRGGQARARGRGEVLSVRVPLPESEHLVVLVPSFGLSTPDVYQAFDQIEVSADDDNLRRFRNDLEPAALKLEPKLGLLLEFLREKTEDQSGMSGSGSACFAFVRSQNQAQQLIKQAERVIECTGYYVRPLPFGNRIIES